MLFYAVYATPYSKLLQNYNAELFLLIGNAPRASLEGRESLLDEVRVGRDKATWEQQLTWSHALHRRVPTSTYLTEFPPSTTNKCFQLSTPYHLSPPIPINPPPAQCLRPASFTLLYTESQPIFNDNPLSAVKLGYTLDLHTDVDNNGPPYR